MHGSPSRRAFLRNASLGLVSASLAPLSSAVTAPYPRTGDSRLRLGLAAYSFRNFFPSMRGNPNQNVAADKRMEMPDFIRYCAKHDCAAELTSYFFDPKVSDQYLADCRQLAHLSAVAISGTAIGNNFSHPKGSKVRDEQMAYTKRWIDRAALLGAPHIRVFAGAHPKGISEEDAERNASEALEEAADYAGKKAIFLGIENHDSISNSARLLRIVKAVKSPWVGVNLDTGNFRADDPYAEIATTAPYAVNVQLKASITAAGKRQKVDIERVAKILRDAGYQGYLVLEYENAADPYSSVPKLLDQMRAFCDS